MIARPNTSSFRLASPWTLRASRAVLAAALLAAAPLVPSLLTPAAARAQSNFTRLKVGDAAPRLVIEQYPNRQVIDLAKIKGKGHVVVHFFLPFGNISQPEFDDLIDARRRFRKRKLAFIGVSCGTVPAQMLGLMQRKAIDWPVEYHPQGLFAPNPQAWGVHGTPVVFLLDPDHKILWTGQPDGLVEELLDVFLDDAPDEPGGKAPDPTAAKPDPAAKPAGRLPFAPADPAADRPAWAAAMDEVESALDDGDFAAAAKRFAALPPDAGDDEEVGPRVADADAALSEAVESAIDEIDLLVTNGDHAAAGRRLDELAAIFAGTPYADAAADRRAELQDDPAFRAATAGPAAEKPDPAAGPSSPAKPPIDAERRARGLLSVADNYRAAGRLDTAREKYRQVVADHPGTAAAKRAEAELKKLGEKK